MVKVNENYLKLKAGYLFPEISKRVNKSASTISVSLKDLQRNNIIERVIMNKSSKISSDIGFKILNGKQSVNNLVKYNL